MSFFAFSVIYDPVQVINLLRSNLINPINTQGIFYFSNRPPRHSSPSTISRLLSLCSSISLSTRLSESNHGWRVRGHCSRNRSQGVYPQRPPLRRWCQGLHPLSVDSLFPFIPSRGFWLIHGRFFDCYRIDLDLNFYFLFGSDLSQIRSLRLYDFELAVLSWLYGLVDWSCCVYG